jgi:hypothetical protein
LFLQTAGIETTDQPSTTTDPSKKLKIILIPNYKVPAIAYCVAHLAATPNGDTGAPIPENNRPDVTLPPVSTLFSIVFGCLRLFVLIVFLNVTFICWCSFY